MITAAYSLSADPEYYSWILGKVLSRLDLDQVSDNETFHVSWTCSHCGKEKYVNPRKWFLCIHLLSECNLIFIQVTATDKHVLFKFCFAKFGKDSNQVFVSLSHTSVSQQGLRERMGTSSLLNRCWKVPELPAGILYAAQHLNEHGKRSATTISIWISRNNALFMWKCQFLYLI